MAKKDVKGKKRNKVSEKKKKVSIKKLAGKFSDVREIKEKRDLEIVGESFQENIPGILQSSFRSVPVLERIAVAQEGIFSGETFQQTREEEKPTISYSSRQGNLYSATRDEGRQTINYDATKKQEGYLAKTKGAVNTVKGEWGNENRGGLTASESRGRDWSPDDAEIRKYSPDRPYELN